MVEKNAVNKNKINYGFQFFVKDRMNIFAVQIFRRCFQK